MRATHLRAAENYGALADDFELKDRTRRKRSGKPVGSPANSGEV
jgi:hypothetical protein